MTVTTPFSAYGRDDVYLADCAWYRRVNRLPGYDPAGVCSFGCREEPACEELGSAEDLFAAHRLAAEVRQLLDAARGAGGQR